MIRAVKYEATFFTATILDWKFLLAPDKYKDIIVNSLRYFVEANKIAVHAFVIMDNHIHLVWHIVHPNIPAQIQGNFLKFTARAFINDLRVTNPDFLQEFYAGKKDRTYQIWKREPLSIDIWSESVLKQKLEYIHSNPVRAGICDCPEDYKYSSASMYLGRANWEFVQPFFFAS